MKPADGATPLLALDAVALDTETTSLDARHARIVQIGAAGVSAGRLVEETFETLVDPGIEVPPAASAIHGIDSDRLAGAPAFAEAWQAFEAFRAGRVVIGHSIGYDLTILARECAIAGIAWDRPRSLCVRLLGQLAGPGLPDQSLDTLAAWLGVEIAGRHTAPGDAAAAGLVFTALVPRLAERGIRTLAEAERASLGLDAALREQVGAGWVEPVRRPETVLAFGKVDPYAYRHRVRDIMSSPPVVIDAGASFREAVDLMVSRRISSVLVAEGAPAATRPDDYAILTERDVMRALAADGAAMLDRPVGPAASRPLASIAGEAFLYRAVGRMHRLKIRHLAVRDEEGNVAGMVSARDLLRLRAGAAIDLEDEIEAAGEATALARAWARLPAVADRLIAEEIDAPATAAIVSEELRVVTRRAAVLAEGAMVEEGHGPPPCAYALMVLGSGGRGESLLAADQDNAVVFAEGAPDGPEDAWFAGFGDRLAATLDRAGIPLCKGGVMAGNPAWRGSVATWKSRVENWVGRSSPDDLLNVDIYFDQRAVHGEVALARQLFDHAFEAGRDQRHFPVLLGERMGMAGSAFNLIGNLRAQDGRLDLKGHGLFPLVSFARAVAIRHDLRHRGTRQRLTAMIEAGIGPEDELQALLEAHAFMLSLLLVQQSRDIAAGIPVSNRVELAGLGRARLARLKRAISAVESLSHLLRSLMAR